MSQYPPQPYPPQGPPMGQPPAYAPPEKKKGIILLVLGLLILVVGGILVVMGIGGASSAVSSASRLGAGPNTFLAPGEHTVTLSPGKHLIMSIDNGDYNGQTYTPDPSFPNSSTVFAVTGPDGAQVPTGPAQRSPSDQTGGFSTSSVREFDAAVAGQYTISVTNPDGMNPRPINIVSFEDFMKIFGGGFAAVGGLFCGAPLALVGIVLLIIWLVVRK